MGRESKGPSGAKKEKKNKKKEIKENECQIRRRQTGKKKLDFYLPPSLF